MFKRKKNIPGKTGDGGSDGAHNLGSKDNFLAVSSKNSIQHSVYPRPVTAQGSPQLARNFQLLKMTKGFDLVLDDCPSEDNHGNSQEQFESTVYKSDRSRDVGYDDKILRSDETKNRFDDSHEVAPSAEPQNISTIQIRKGYGRELLDSETRVAVSEVMTTKQPLVQKSSNSFVVCKTALDSPGNEHNTSENVHNIAARNLSFQNSLRKFTNKPTAVPPPVAKKPARSDSGKKSSPDSDEWKPVIRAVDAQDKYNDLVNTQNVVRDANTDCVVLRRSHNAENSAAVNIDSPARKHVSCLVTGKRQTPHQPVDDGKSNSHPNLSSNFGKNLTKNRNSTIGYQVSTISVSKSLTSLSEKTDLVVINALETKAKSQPSSDTQMNHYNVSKAHGSPERRNRVGNFVEEVRSSFIQVHGQFEERNPHVRDADSKLSSVKRSPPDIPPKMPIYGNITTDSAFPAAGTFKNSACHFFVSSPSPDAITSQFKQEELLTSDPDAAGITHIYENVDMTEKTKLEGSPETKKRLSSTPNYDNWTINRALTTTNRDFLSGSEDEEVDELSSSTASPFLERQGFSKGSRDSGLCDDLSASEITHADTHIEPDLISGHAKGIRSEVHGGHYTQVEDQTFPERFGQGIDLHHRGTQDQIPVNEPDPCFQKQEIDASERSFMQSDGDEEPSPTMDNSYDETDSAREGMLKMRQLLVKGVLDSEKTYLGILSLLTGYKRQLEVSSTSSQPVISKEDIQIIFSDIDTVNEIHTEFVKALEPKVMNWTHEEEIGEIFKIMISKLIDFGKYLNNYQLAVSTIHKCCEENEQFASIAKHMPVNSTIKEVTNLEDALFKPVQRVQRNTLTLHDLIKYTPEDHPDYFALQKALKLSQHIIGKFASLIPQKTNAQENRRLVKSSFLVELVGGVRKLRYIFLFSDVLICTKRETHRNNKVSFDVKWFVPLSQASIDTKFAYSDDMKPSNKDNIDELKEKLRSQKRELKTELRKSDDKDKHRSLVSLGGGAARNVEKIRKKVNQTEAQLILASPRLPFKVLIEDGKTHTLLMSTDYEREEWKETITSLCKKVSHPDQSSQTMSPIQIQEMVNSVKETPQVNKIGTVLLQKDEDILTGTLNVTIHKVNGLLEPCDTYCIMEMDSYGHFFFKAKTTICEGTRDPAWNEDFDLDLESSQTLRILCFRKEAGSSGDTLLGRGALELSKNWLKNSFQEKTLSLNEVSLVVSVRHIPAEKTMQRTPSRSNCAVFGVAISTCGKRERKTVPTVVVACIQEVEKRGLDEVGIYRVSGVSSELQNIKRLLDKNVRACTAILQDADIHAVTGTLKMYFRELPEPLFTEASYQSFIDTLKLSDEETKTQCILALFHGLPDTNYYTAVYLLEHLIKVAKNVGENKMSIHNLSTIFGPTLLAPASKHMASDPLEMMCKGAEQVMYQSSVINFLLGLAVSGKSLRRSA